MQTCRPAEAGTPTPELPTFLQRLDRIDRAIYTMPRRGEDTTPYQPFFKRNRFRSLDVRHKSQ